MLINNMAKTKQKVLIVDDDDSFLFILKKGFSEAGFLVITAKDGADCLSAVEEEKPALIVSDILLPGLDGIEMAKKLRKKNIETPIVFLSNVTDQEQLDSIRQIKRCDYLIKSNVQVSDIIVKAKDILIK